MNSNHFNTARTHKPHRKTPTPPLAPGTQVVVYFESVYVIVPLCDWMIKEYKGENSHSLPSQVQWRRFSAPSTLFQCCRWKKAYAIASLSPRFSMCSGGSIKLFISKRYCRKTEIICKHIKHVVWWLTGACLTLGTCGLNSTALCMASTAFISAVLKPRLDAASGENLQNEAQWIYLYWLHSKHKAYPFRYRGKSNTLVRYCSGF